MTRGRLTFITLSLTTVLLLAGTTMLAANNRQQDDGSDSMYKYLSVFTEVFSLVNRAYVDELEVEPLMTGAVEGTIDALDPFSFYVPAERVAAYQQGLAAGGSRSGMLVLKERGVAYVVAVEEGSPADEAGLESGHIIAAIDGERTRTLPLHEIHSRLAGPAGTVLELEKIHQGKKEMVKLELADYQPPPVTLTVREGVGVLRLPGLHDGTAASVETSLTALEPGSEALPELETADKLLIDLRGVAGGDETAAYAVAGFFAGGELGALKKRGEVLDVWTGDEAPRWQGRLAVLIDRGTQGAAEILAQILKQSAGAALVGEGSFGHSGRQSMVELSNGGRLVLTDAFYTGPDREPITDSLEPDVEVRTNGLDDDEEDAKPEDTVLDRGLKFLLEDEELEARQAA